jgi:hypothetical protein
MDSRLYQLTAEQGVHNRSGKGEANAALASAKQPAVGEHATYRLRQTYLSIREGN